MSAFIVSKTHIDLLVRAAIEAGSPSDHFRWWLVDENGDYAGWRELDEYHGFGPELSGRSSKVGPDFLGQLLVDENVRSVSYRYDGLDDLPGPVTEYWRNPYDYEDPLYTLTPGEVFAAIDCLDYQSCEHDEWRKSEAFAFLETLRNAYCRKLSGDAPLSFDEEWLAEQEKDTSISLMSLIKKRS